MRVLPPPGGHAEPDCDTEGGPPGDERDSGDARPQRYENQVTTILKQTIRKYYFNKMMSLIRIYVLLHNMYIIS